MSNLKDVIHERGLGDVMKRRVIASTIASFAIAIAGQARAGIYTDDMSKCLVKNTSDADKSVLVQWIFASISVNPNIKPLTNVNDAQRTAFEQKAADLMQRLLLVDCHKETVEAIKYEGVATVQSSFEVLGRVAMANIMSSPTVMAEMSAFATHIDKKKFEALAKEAGQ